VVQLLLHDGIASSLHFNSLCAKFSDSLAELRRDQFAFPPEIVFL
jgi:hypothetical protein